MLTPELMIILNSLGARLRATKFKNRTQLVEMKNALNELLDPQIAELDKKAAAAHQKKQKDRAEKEKYRSKFRQSWVKSHLPAGATVKVSGRTEPYQVLVVHGGSILLSTPDGKWIESFFHCDVVKVMGSDGKFLDVYEIAAKQETPELKLPATTSQEPTTVILP